MLSQYIQNPDSIDAHAISECESLLQKYPYFEAVHLLYLKSVRKIDEDRYREVLPKHICHIKNNKSLFFIAEGANCDWLQLCTLDEKNNAECVEEKDAVDMIDSFLEAYRVDKKKQTEQEGVSSCDFVPIIDYGYLTKMKSVSLSADEQVKQPPKSYQDELIDRFMEEIALRDKPFKLNDEPVPEPVVSTDNHQKKLQEEPLSENLAKNYIKQRRYEEALEIIQKLSLIYPEKNIYFADQIRFLRKLIININSK